ncbi:nitrogen regulation protein NR [Vibrio albus]|uniref:Nitrogen regulation protein NR n=1 Tax=Vibrio albus TaxID=2200953 RepID=A0A2U3B850_9VIBR|nr:DUF4124 domain-containing protein [Vibrio albus]PWI32951.1 nitrogen regulation protein NR [Vibrio albus]
MKIWTYTIIFILMCPAVSTAQEIYSWEDENGVIHFSEYTPPASASKQEQVSLPDIKAPAPAPKVLSALPLDNKKTQTPLPPEQTQQDRLPQATKQQMATKPSPKQDEPDKLLDIQIVTPADKQTVRSNRGVITIVLEANRALKPREHYQLIMDDNRFGAPQTNTVWNLKDIDRGTHSFTVNALQSGKIIASTSTIKVHLHRSSVKK